MGELAETLRAGRARFEEGLRALLARHGAVDDAQLAAAVREAVDHTLEALVESATDLSGALDDDARSESLRPLDVVRIRANKLAAARLAPALWRAPRALAALRAEIHALALAWLGPEAARGARFGGPGAP